MFNSAGKEGNIAKRKATKRKERQDSEKHNLKRYYHEEVE